MTDENTRMTPAEAGAYLGTAGKPVSKNTLAFWRTTGTGPIYVKLGLKVQYLKSDLDAFLSAGRRNPEART